MSSDRIQQLETVEGWVWGHKEKESQRNFQEGLKKLKEYVEQNHHARVPNNYTDKSSYNLGSWVFNRRTEYKNGKLSSDRIQQLEEVKGWVWGARVK